MKYQHKPIEAIQLKHDMSNWRDVCIFKNEDDIYPADVECPPFLDIFTVNRWWHEMTAGEWLIKDGNEFTVLSDVEFNMKYDKI